jgi:hypothetical protein
VANLLTGDYEAVLQVSEATVNRLLASMHQHGANGPLQNYPTFPHTVSVRLGDVVPIDGVRGTLWAQVSAPRIELIHGATDRFRIKVAVRSRYRPDPDTEPFPTYVHGRVEAEYALEDIPRDCRGWGKLASSYLWFRAVERSVTFTGDASYEDDFSVIMPPDEATMNAQITKQLAVLLVHVFEAAPHKVGPRFRKGSFKSLAQAPGTVNELPVPFLPSGVFEIPVGGNAVVVPLGVAQDPPPGLIDSPTNVVLADRDFAVAVSSESIMALVEPALDVIRSYQQTWSVTVSTFWDDEAISTVYRGSVDSASAQWLPYGSHAVISVEISGGVRTDSVLPNIDFTVTQPFHLDFDPGDEVLRVWPLSNTVTAHASGLGLPSDSLNAIAQGVGQTVQNLAGSAAASLASTLDGMSSKTQELRDVLASLDYRSDAHLDDGRFHASGIVLRGWISVARRKKPVVKFKKIDADNISALESWIPGGGIDSFEWSWSWFNFVRPPGDARYRDRYVLRRQRGTSNGFGYLVGRVPIPGLDGSGQVCLHISGWTTDTTTGDFMRMFFGPICTRFGWPDMVRIDAGRLHLREYLDAQPQGVPRPPGPVETGLVDVTARHARAVGTNTLLVVVPEAWDDAAEATLVEGLAGCDRKDAGLLVMVLLRDGALADGGELNVRLGALADRLPAPLLVNEDVDGAWSRAFAVNSAQVAWRLLGSDGGVLWMGEGPVSAEHLTGVLDRNLYPCPPATPVALDENLEELFESPAMLGWLFDHHHVLDPAAPRERAKCPPWVTVQPGELRDVVAEVSFVRQGEVSTANELERMRNDHGHKGADDPGAVIVLDGADEREAEALAESLGPAFTVIPDPDGFLAGGVGVRRWPTSVSIGVSKVTIRDEDEEEMT